jgi:hypothetical protein
MLTVVGSQLLQSEHQADVGYGLPLGTMETLGMSESSQGTNTGSIGNIFQVTPSTASKPGYGLSSVQGNDPNSVAAYLSALIHGPGGGSVANGLALYQGRPIGSTGNTAMSGFVTELNAQMSDALNMVSLGTMGTNRLTGQKGAASNLPGIGLQIAMGLLAIAFIIVGIAALAMKSDPVQAAVKVAKVVAP